MDPQPETRPESQPDSEKDRIVAEEERVLDRVRRTVEARAATRPIIGIDYDAELISLRDQINEARLEDVPPLIEEMERLQQVAARRAQVIDDAVDLNAPYFGRMVLEEGDRKREVLIGRRTFLDSRTGIRIVDWRDAPVSRLYYRYEEGDDYEENFGGKSVEGEILVRRNLAIAGGILRRIGSPQGTFLKDARGAWHRADVDAIRLRGGQGAALRPEDHHRPRKLGVLPGVEGREDRHLPEIAALIDPRQFELITKPDSGLVVIQGGAGSGKTTIGLHRLGYLAFQDPKRFRPDRLLVVVFNDALARYISRVLPALGVPGVLVTTYERWAHKQRATHLHGLPRDYSDETPTEVVRLKKHPRMLRLIERRSKEIARRVDEQVRAAVQGAAGEKAALLAWANSADRPVGKRVERLWAWLHQPEGEAKNLDVAARHALERALRESARSATDVLTVWAELLTDGALLRGAFEGVPGLGARDLDRAIAWCVRECASVLQYRDQRLDPEARAEARHEETSARSTRLDDEPEPPDDNRDFGVDGAEEAERVAVDREDDTLFLCLYRRLCGGLGRHGEPLRYEHVFVDEAQDMSPVELSVVLEATSGRKSVTLAGDLAQRLHLDNGFSDWRSVLHELELDHVEVEPLKLSYRSTHEIIEFSTEILGPLRNEEQGKATRHGAPVEMFRFADTGEAVGFIAEALRDLMHTEPRASVAVIARFPEHAELYANGLRTAEVPHVRWIADQDFPFRPGVDVTDVRQVKGLEFDYVVLVEVNASTYGEDDESRHLLHIAATRAAHQLWLTATAVPSKILPEALRLRNY